jgi:hypothetical protein
MSVRPRLDPLREFGQSGIRDPGLLATSIASGHSNLPAAYRCGISAVNCTDVDSATSRTEACSGHTMFPFCCTTAMSENGNCLPMASSNLDEDRVSNRRFLIQASSVTI